jgi:dGTPase
LRLKPQKVEWNKLLSASRDGQKEPISAEQSRSAFEQDFDRIIFSHPFRRLQDKTQVHPLPEQDFVHTRLTHSLEVSSVGRSLGRKVGEVILQRHKNSLNDFSLVDFGAVVASASLAHDLGNPPFGHAGENAISDFFAEHEAGKVFQDKVSEAEWRDLTSFEGNAQGFRILNKNQYGLKLTFATLGAFTKYPCPAFFPDRNKSKRSQKKFGFFQTEKEIFERIANQLALTKTTDSSWCRHPLAFLVEAADDICYSIIDLEDGCNLGLVTYADARELLMGVITASKSKLGKLDHLHTREEKIGFLRALAIYDLTVQCAELFLDHEKEILNAGFDTALADCCVSKNELKQIIQISIDKIYKSKHVVEIEASGHEILPGLLEEFVKAGAHIIKPRSSRKYDNMVRLLPENLVAIIQSKPENQYHMLRHVVDFISGLTDRHALSLYRKIKGIAF